MTDLRAPQLHKEYLDTVRDLPDLDRVGRRRAAEYMCHSEAIYHNEVIDFLSVPKLYAQADIERFQDIVTITYAILEKVTAAYVNDPAYRKHFSFSPQLEELILLDPGYSCAIPIMRMDLFYDEVSGDFQFCEFNTDGSSAMNEDREISTALSLTPSFQEFTRRHPVKPFELFDSWVACFLDIYHNSTHGRAASRTQPTVVIADFLELTTSREIARFREHFEATGATAHICDIRDLRFDGTQLRTSSGLSVDALYRRAVTTDIMKHYDEVSDFLAAYRAGAFTLIGSFRTQIAHVKTVFEVLHLPETSVLLTPEEQSFVRAHVPRTLRLKKNSPEFEHVLTDKDAWIIKPLDSYASQGVISGREVSQNEWDAILESAAQHDDHIAQAYVEQYEADNLTSGFKLTEGEEPTELDALPRIEAYRDLTGLFVYGGEFRGFLARAGRQNRICAAANGKTLGTFQLS